MGVHQISLGGSNSPCRDIETIRKTLDAWHVMNDLKLLEGMPESLFFASDSKVLKFPITRLGVWKQGGNRLFWTYTNPASFWEKNI